MPRTKKTAHKKEAKKIRDSLLNKGITSKVKKKNYLSLGVTTWNMAAANYPFGGLKPGHAYLICGPSGSGKTAVINTILAQATLNPFYNDYELIVDNSEDGNQFDMEACFNKEVEDRIKAPAYDENGEPIFSTTPQDMFRLMRKAMRKGPCIFIEDSMDALMAAEEKEVYEARMEEEDGGEKAKGSMGAEKAKENYRGFRYSLSLIKQTKSIVIIIAHEKEKIGSFGFGDKRYHSGGKAMKFFASLEMYMKRVSTLKREFKAKKALKVGIDVEVDIKKNRGTGKERTVSFPIYYETGIDDIASCIEFLLYTEHWKKKSGDIAAPEFNFDGREEALIAELGNKVNLKKLRLLVRDVWHEVESKVSVKRFSEFARE